MEDKTISAAFILVSFGKSAMPNLNISTATKSHSIPNTIEKPKTPNSRSEKSSANIKKQKRSKGAR